MNKERATDLSLDAAKWIGEKAQSRIDRMDRAVEDAHTRSEAIKRRTQGTAYDAFGRERQRVGNELLDNPPHKLASAVKFGTIVISGALLLYKVLKR